MTLSRLLCPFLILSLAGCFDHVMIGEGLFEAGEGGQGGDSAAPSGGSAGNQDGSVSDAWLEDSGLESAGGTSGDTGAGDSSWAGEGGAAGADGAVKDAGPGQPCGSGLCAPGAECCYMSAKCFDPAVDPGACEIPPPDGAPGKPCGADSHCSPGEYCRNDNDFMCMGKGRCMARTAVACAQLLSNPTCACDGVTRPQTESCQLGLRSLASPTAAGCGEPVYGAVRMFCGNNSDWCPGGTLCCGITGLCYDPAVPDLCRFPLEGSYLPCANDLDCPKTLGVCQGLTCGEPGGCIRKPWQCAGPDLPVCGCDDKPYMNDTCALHEGVAVKHPGACQDSGT